MSSGSTNKPTTPATKSLGIRTYDTMHTATPAKSKIPARRGRPPDPPAIADSSDLRQWITMTHQWRDYALSIEAAARELADYASGMDLSTRSLAGLREKVAALRRAMGEEGVASDQRKD